MGKRSILLLSTVLLLSDADKGGRKRSKGFTMDSRLCVYRKLENSMMAN